MNTFYRRITRAQIANAQPYNILQGTSGTDYLGITTIPAGGLVPGTNLRFSAWGRLRTGDPPGTLAIAATLGPAGQPTVVATGSVTLTADRASDEWNLWSLLTVRTDGTGGTLVCNGFFLVSTPSQTSLESE